MCDQSLTGIPHHYPYKHIFAKQQLFAYNIVQFDLINREKIGYALFVFGEEQGTACAKIN